MRSHELPHKQKPRIVRVHRGWVVVPMARFGWAQQDQYLNAKAWCEQQNHKEHNRGRSH